MKVINFLDRLNANKSVNQPMVVIEEKMPVVEEKNHSRITFESLEIESLIKGEYLTNDELASLKRFENLANNEKNRRVTWDRYQHVPTQQLVKTVGDHLIRSGYDFDVKLVFGAKGKSTKHIAQFTLNNMMLDRGNMAVKILVMNSYNGECPITVLGGAIRFCCANGIIAGENQSFEKIVHIVGETINDRLRRLTEKIDIAADYLKNNFGTRIETMASMESNYVKEIDILLGLDVTEKVKMEVIRRRHPKNIAELRIEDRGQNLWCFFNVVNEVIRDQSRTGLLEVESNLNLIDEIIRLAA
jgi:hypothetical protein